MSKLPKIEIIHDDLVQAAYSCPENFFAIAHGCNCEKTMGAGIARQIAKTFPAAAKADRDTHDVNRPGSITYAYCKTAVKPAEGYDSSDILVVNMYTQETYARPGDTEPPFKLRHLKTAFGAFTCLARNLPVAYKRRWIDYPRIGIPRIGCGLGGGNWEEVENFLLKETPAWMRFAVYVL